MLGKEGSMLVRLILQLLVSGSELTAPLPLELDEDFLKNVQPAGRATIEASSNVKMVTAIHLFMSKPSSSRHCF